VAHTVRFTENFANNLDSIRDYFAVQEAESLFEQLLDRLFEEFVPNLGRFPRMGRSFLDVEPNSDEGRALLARLRERAGKEMEIREYIAGDYLILYAIRKSTVFLLAIRHHLQLSFDLKGHWL